MSAAALHIGSIERKTLNELAYEQLKGALLSGRLGPGPVITLRQLAAEFGTSMMPVREAVARLAAEQALEVLPNRGIRIPELTAAEWKEVWTLRIKLEGDAVAQAARAATAADIERIRLNCTRVREAAESGLLHDMLEANNTFQFSIFLAARTRVLLRFVETLRMQTVPHTAAALASLLNSNDPFLAQTLAHHDTIVEAIAARDPTTARRTKQRDLDLFRSYVERVTPR